MAALVLDVCFAIIAFIVIETLHTQISSLFLGKDGTALAYQVSGGYMRWIGYFFVFSGNQDGNRRGPSRDFGMMRPISHCKYGQPRDPSVSCPDLCAPFWYRICLACGAGGMACKLSDLLYGSQKVVAG